MNDNHVDEPQIYQGDCLGILPTLAANSVDLIVTSPPYTDQRKDTYGGVSPDRYVEWFLPIADELKRVLKNEGSFILRCGPPIDRGGSDSGVINAAATPFHRIWYDTEPFRNSY